MCLSLSVIATWVDTDPAAPLVTIGRAVPGYFLYILDADLNPCPVGVAGELHIGGLCVARGYLNRDDLTKEKFIPFPRNKVWQQHMEEEQIKKIAGLSPRLYKAGVRETTQTLRMNAHATAKAGTGSCSSCASFVDPL